MSRYLTNLIFDRTQADVLNETDKAFISYADLNRVEEACSYLASLLNVTIQTKTWVMTDYRTVSEMVRLRSNINTLKNAYYANPDSPLLPSVINYQNIKEANTIEKILYDIETMWLQVSAGLPKLGFKLGMKNIGNREV